MDGSQGSQQSDGESPHSTHGFSDGDRRAVDQAVSDDDDDDDEEEAAEEQGQHDGEEEQRKHSSDEIEEGELDEEGELEETRDAAEPSQASSQQDATAGKILAAKVPTRAGVAEKIESQSIKFTVAAKRKQRVAPIRHSASIVTIIIILLLLLPPLPPSPLLSPSSRTITTTTVLLILILMLILMESWPTRHSAFAQAESPIEPDEPQHLLNDDRALQSPLACVCSRTFAPQ